MNFNIPQLTFTLLVQRQRRSGVFIANFEHVSHLSLVFLLKFGISKF